MPLLVRPSWYNQDSIGRPKTDSVLNTQAHIYTFLTQQPNGSRGANLLDLETNNAHNYNGEPLLTTRARHVWIC